MAKAVIIISCSLHFPVNEITYLTYILNPNKALAILRLEDLLSDTMNLLNLYTNLFQVTELNLTCNLLHLCLNKLNLLCQECKRLSNEPYDQSSTAHRKRKDIGLHVKMSMPSATEFALVSLIAPYVTIKEKVSNRLNERLHITLLNYQH